MNPAEDAELLAKELLVEALRALSGRWSLVLTPAVAAAVIPLVQGSMALARLGMSEGIPSTSFRAELRVARAVVDEHGRVEAPESEGSCESGLPIPGSQIAAAGLAGSGEGASATPRGSQARSGLDSPSRGAIVGGRVVDHE